MQREVEVNRKLYSILRERLEEARIAEAEKVPDVSIVNPALLPTSPVNVRPKLYAFIGGMLGLLIGMVLSFVVESFDTSMGTIEDVEAALKIPVLGVVPSVAHGSAKSANLFQRFRRSIFGRKNDREEEIRIRLISHYRPTSPIAEAFRNIKTNLQLSPLRKTFLITSSSAEEGKTTTLTNLGLVCAQDGFKTLLVSSDLRRPAIAESFGLDRKAGLCDFITGTAPLKDCLRSFSDIILAQPNIDDMLKDPGLSHLWILPSGSYPHNPTEILNSSEFSSLIQRLKQDFDVLLFDSPPILPVTDASILATKVDKVVLCYEIGRTSRDALIRAKTQLNSVNADIQGVVLNHIKQTVEAGTTYPYYYWYRYYRRKPDEDIK